MFHCYSLFTCFYTKRAFVRLVLRAWPFTQLATPLSPFNPSNWPQSSSVIKITYPRPSSTILKNPLSYKNTLCPNNAMWERFTYPLFMSQIVFNFFLETYEFSRILIYLNFFFRFKRVFIYLQYSNTQGYLLYIRDLRNYSAHITHLHGTNKVSIFYSWPWMYQSFYWTIVRGSCRSKWIVYMQVHLVLL